MFLKKAGLVSFGFTIAFILLELGLRLAGYAAISSQNRKARTGIDFSDKNQYRILCIGESTTAEIYVDDHEGAWPKHLEKLLNTENKGPRTYKTINMGVPGRVTAFILAELKDQIEAYRPQLVITMMGINDRWSVIQFDDKPSSRVNLFFQRFRIVKLFQILSRAFVDKLTRTPLKKPAHLPPINDPKLINDLNAAVHRGDPKQSHAVFDALLKKYPDRKITAYSIYSTAIHFGLRGGRFVNDESLTEATSILHELIDIDKPESSLSGTAYASLTYVYSRRQKWPDFFNVCRKAIEKLDKETDKHVYINSYMLVAKDHRPDDPYLAELKQKYSISSTDGGRYTAVRAHYNRYWAVLKENRIRYAAMQYPTLDVRLLKYFFSNDHVPAIDSGNAPYFGDHPDPKYDDVLKDDPDITFISNEEPFLTALASHPYEEYFIDRFGGSFGHTTVLGHQLIAETAARALKSSKILDR